MSILQHETIATLPRPSKKMNEKPPVPHGLPPRDRTVWGQFFWGLFVTMLALGGGTLASLLGQTERATRLAVDQFSWMVLVRGEALQMDEVGRDLKTLPGAREVVFVSNQEAFAQLQQDPLYLGDMRVFEPADLPSAWRVKWDFATLDFSNLELWQEDIRRLPSVIDVAYDRHTINTIKHLRSFWYRLQLALSSILLVGILLSVFLLGRFFFFVPAPHFRGREFLITLMVDQLCWTAGVAFVHTAIGPVDWPVWLLGLVLGTLHFIWKSHVRA